MRLENIVALTTAKLLTQPEVSTFETFVFEASKVKRGDLFVALNPQEIPQALENGAYAILFDTPVDVSDAEVAWIEVEDLQNALLRLLRFRLLENEIQAFSTHEIIVEIAYGVETSQALIVADGTIDALFRSLWEAPKKSLVLFSPQRVKADLFANANELPTLQKESIEIMERTLFETSFIFANHYYERIEISPFFIPFLQKLLNFLKQKGVSFSLRRRFERLSHFKIVFTNRSFLPKEFGSSELVLIFEEDMELFAEEIHFLQTHAPWARSIYILPSSYNDLDTYENCFYYNSQEEIFDILHRERFHFALIGGVTQELLDRVQKNQQPRQLAFEF